MSGTFRFLNRSWDIVTQIAPAYKTDFVDRLHEATSLEEKTLRRRTHQAVVKTGDDIADLRFNTAVSELMKLSDSIRKFVAASGTDSPALHEAAHVFVQLLSPLAPHIADELWERFGYSEFLYNAKWPTSDPQVAQEEEITLVVQVNGKLRDKLTLPANTDAKACELAALSSDKVKELTEGKPVKKVVVIPGKLVNIVV
jgi:leucyl-tRNA synthetase